MTRTGRLLVATVVCAVFGVMTAAASLVPFSSARLASGNVAVSQCDTDGVSVSYTSAFDTTAADYRTSAVTVSGIASTCFGRTLSVTVRSASGVLWQGSATVAGTSATLTATPFVSSAVAGWAVVVTG